MSSLEMLRIASLLLAVNVSAGRAIADVSTTFDDAQWQSWVGAYATIDFTGYPDGTPISNQYADLGVTFTGPSFIFATNGLVNDGWGLHGPSGLHLLFAEPQIWIAIHHAANARFDLYSEGQLIGTSAFDPVGGIDSFLGVISTIAFDEVFIINPPPYGPHVIIDDLHWGAPVPAPGVLALMGIACLTAHRRRR